MGNFIFGYNQILAASMITPSSEDANYPKANMLDLGHLKRHYRSTVITEVTLVIDFTTAKAVDLVFLNEVNFTDVYIQGNATNVWTSPSFSQQYAISEDVRVNRYKLCAILTGFNYRYMRIRIPSQTPTGGASYFRIGSLFITIQTIVMSMNPVHPYEYEASEAKPQAIDFLSGSKEKISRGSDKIWEGSFAFRGYPRTSEDDLWSLDALGEDEYIVFFENLGDTSKGYLCRKENSIRVSWDKPFAVDLQPLTLREAV